MLINNQCLIRRTAVVRTRMPGGGGGGASRGVPLSQSWVELSRSRWRDLVTAFGASLPLGAAATNDEVCPILLKNSVGWPFGASRTNF